MLAADRLGRGIVMFGNHWGPGNATVVMSETVINAKAGYHADYVLDVQPADGSPMFRATVRSPAFVGFMQQPDGAVVPVEINSKNNEVRFDMSDPRLNVTLKVEANHGAFEAAASAPAGTPPTGPAGISATDGVATALDELRSAVAELGGVTAGMARERANTTETLAAIKAARAAGDLAEVDRLKAEWVANNPPPTATI
jgi:hypothetical protein